MTGLYDTDILQWSKHQAALLLLPDTIDGRPPWLVSQVCPVVLDELLAEP